jgi:ABC-type transport system involved in multi-copper enzyme maturation permease subunit
MFREVFGFELGYRLRQPVVYVFAVVFFLMAFMAVSTDSVQIGGGIGNVARNAPYVIIRMLILLSGTGLIFVAIMVASAVNRDRELGTHELLFSTPVSKLSYLSGRFAGSVILALLTMIVAACGILAGSLMPWQDPEHLVPFRFVPYVYALGIFVLPNVFLSGASFFAAATLTRRAFYAYVAVIGFLAFWAVSNELTHDLENRHVGALLDPLGLGTFALITRYWTVVERSTELLPLTGTLLLNRLLWIGLGVGCLVLTLARFRMEMGEDRASRRRLHRRELVEVTGATPLTMAIPTVRLAFAGRTRLTQWLWQTRAEVSGVLRSIPFIVIMIFGLCNLFFGSLVAGIEGTISYPVTRRMLSEIAGTFDQFLLIVIVIYSGEMVWRERHRKMHELFDGLPVPNWVPLTAKLTALGVICVMALAVAMLATMVFQIARGYFNFELGLYLKSLFVISLAEWLQLCVLTLFVQVLVNQKYLGYLVMVLYFVAMEALPVMGFGHHLSLYGTTPPAPYSDMNGYGHFVAPLFWFNVYWALLAVVLMLLANLLWVRGTDNRVRLRLQLVRERMNRSNVTALATATIGFALVGGWIFYNTNILNDYRTSGERNRLAALYEQRYKQYDGLLQPRLTDVTLEVDIYPESRRVDIRGDLHLVNQGDQAIEKLHVFMNTDLEINAFSLPDDALELEDREVGYRIYKLDEPLAPDDPLDLSFDVSLITRGFVNNRSNTLIVENGTFFDNFDYVPCVGYTREHELVNPDDRKEYDLPPRARMAPVNDLEARRNTPFSHAADRITFEAVVSTCRDQVAIAPGYLQRESAEGDRRYFHYKMDAPIFNMYSFLSGRYEIRRDKWNDVDIAIYHHKNHGYNVDCMIDSIKKALDYYTANFSPYQHRQLRIIEFPRYRPFAQSFPNTIPFSESAHFVDDLRDAEDIDMVFYITAHEVAHQWWGHQVCGGAVQGWSMLIESMAQYAAFMVMEKQFGREQIKRLLAYELDRYLSGRANERINEMPLMLVENQAYVHYCKGSLVMYALRDYLGEEVFNTAVRKFIKATAYQDPPYTNSLEFLGHVREVMPENLRYLIEDMFETITLYDNRAEEATFTRTDDERYAVNLVYQSRKMRADGQGVETEIDHNDWIEIGVFGEERIGGTTTETILHLEKHRLSAGRSELEIIVDQEPIRAGIDPRNLLIDRVPGDNIRTISR